MRWLSFLGINIFGRLMFTIATRGKCWDGARRGRSPASQDISLRKGCSPLQGSESIEESTGDEEDQGQSGLRAHLNRNQ